MGNYSTKYYPDMYHKAHCNTRVGWIFPQSHINSTLDSLQGCVDPRGIPWDSPNPVQSCACPSRTSQSIAAQGRSKNLLHNLLIYHLLYHNMCIKVEILSTQILDSWALGIWLVLRVTNSGHVFHKAVYLFTVGMILLKYDRIWRELPHHGM